MRLFKKGMGIMLAASMLASLCACGNSSGSQTTESAVQKESTESAGGDVSSEQVTLDLFINHTWWPLQSWSGTVPEYITGQTGVNLNVTVAADAQQLPLMISSGELPDLIYTDNTGNMISLLSDPDLCWSWEDLMAESNTDFTFDESRAKINRTNDGKFYTIRNNYSTPEELEEYDAALVGVMLPTVRKSVYEELGSPEIKTTEDFYNLLKTVKEKYPDLIPCMFNTNWTGAGQTSCQFLTDFGLVNSNFSYDENKDEVSYYIFQDGRLDYYKFMNKLYREGLMIAENYAFNNEDESYQYAYNLQCFAYIKGSNAKELNQECATLGTDQDWMDLYTALNYDDSFKIYDSNIGWSGLFVSKNCKAPEAAARLLAYLFSDEGMRTAFWGIEGDMWNWSEDNKYPVFCDEYTDNDWQEKNGLTEWGLLSGTWATERLSYYNPDDEVADQLLTLSNQAKEKTVSCPAVGLVIPEADSEEQNIKSKLDTMVTNEEMKIYLAESEEACEAAYYDMLDLARQQGADELNTWANKAYQEAKAAMEN